MTAAPLRFGILGTAKIARSFVAGVKLARSAAVVAVASRDAARAQDFAAELGIDAAYGSYEQLLRDPGVDAVYIPLPNSLHADWAIRAAQAGKHILCEKPIAASAVEARSMFEAARRAGVLLVEGFPFRAQPQTLRLQEMIAAGAIGTVRMIQASFGFTLAQEENIRWSTPLAGGAVMDIGVYPICLVRMIAGVRPTRVTASAQWAGTDDGVDRAVAATLQFADGLSAQIACSFDACLHRQALIVGSAGVLQTTYLNHTTATLPGSLQWRRGSDARAVDSIIETPVANGFQAEVDAFVAAVRHDPAQWSGATAEESIDNMLTIEALLRSARAGGTPQAVDGGAPP
jgi:xylose dehydrogenase (NAD/NADP)